MFASQNKDENSIVPALLKTKPVSSAGTFCSHLLTVPRSSQDSPGTNARRKDNPSSMLAALRANRALVRSVSMHGYIWEIMCRNSRDAFLRLLWRSRESLRCVEVRNKHKLRYFARGCPHMQQAGSSAQFLHNQNQISSF